ncbi:MAG TPA: ABC transporter permease [Caulobacteraceae bacterium]
MNKITLYRILAVAIPLALIELACRLGWINRLTLPPPSEMVVGLWGILKSGRMNAAMLETLRNVIVAFAGSVVAGIAAGALVHGVAPVRRLLEPLFSTYYAVPIYGFYPLFIVMFGLGDKPEILIGFMLAVVAVITATLAGLDGVPRVLVKTARVLRLGPVRTAWQVTLPYAAPQLFTGVKLAAAYSFIGVIGAEFIMSQSGLGYEIRFAYDNLDNNVMYPLILLVLVVAVAMNGALDAWDRRLRERRRAGR